MGTKWDYSPWKEDCMCEEELNTSELITKKKTSAKLTEHCYCFSVFHQLKNATFTRNSAQRNKNVAYYAVILKFMCKAMLLYGDRFLLSVCVTKTKRNTSIFSPSKIKIYMAGGLCMLEMRCTHTVH